MSQNLPNGPGICYQPDANGIFDFQPMISSGNWSYESLWWLSYMQSLPPFRTETRQINIQHILNGGEKEIVIEGRRYRVDGYAEIDGIKYFLEFDGCRFHRHTCVNSLRSTLPQKDDSQRNLDLEKAGVLLKTFECEWLAVKKNVSVENIVSTFFGRSNIMADDIMSAIKNDKFYGLIRCDLKSPQSVVDHFLKMNHPPIYAHKSIEKDMIGSTMQKLLDERGVKYPLEKQLTLVFNHDQYLMTTDLAKFYLEKGLELSNLTLAIEYTKSRPLANFVETVTEKRKEATRIGDQHLQNTWKLISNSSYGRMSLNLLKRRKYDFKKASEAPTVDDKPLIMHVTPVQGEFPTEYVEITRKKKITTDKVPGKISVLKHEKFLSLSRISLYLRKFCRIIMNYKCSFLSLLYTIFLNIFFWSLEISEFSAGLILKMNINN